MISKATRQARILATQYRDDFCKARSFYESHVEDFTDAETLAREKELRTENKLPWEKP